MCVTFIHSLAHCRVSLIYAVRDDARYSVCTKCAHMLPRSYMRYFTHLCSTLRAQIVLLWRGGGGCPRPQGLVNKTSVHLPARDGDTFLLVNHFTREAKAKSKRFLWWCLRSMRGKAQKRRLCSLAALMNIVSSVRRPFLSHLRAGIMVTCTRSHTAPLSVAMNVFRDPAMTQQTGT